MKRLYICLLLSSMLTLTLSAQNIQTVNGFAVADGQAGNVTYSYGQLFSHQVRATDGADLVTGVQQAQFIHEDIDTAFCQNDVKPVAGFDFHSVDAEGNLIQAGQYDSAHYCPSSLNYDSLTEITLTVWPVYEKFDTLYLSHTEMTERSFEPGRNDRLLSSIHDCDSLIHYMIYVCQFPIVRDGDGHNYDNLWLGHECWTSSNLQATRYTDGSDAPNMIYNSNLFPNTADNIATYGRLYTWQSAVGLPEGSSEMPARTADGNHFVQGICPTGWHIPTSDNAALFAALPADMLKSTSLWLTPGNNEMGFDARPAGFYNPNTDRFENLLGYTHYWSDQSVSLTAASSCTIAYGCNVVLTEDRNRQQGLSIRCVKDNVYSDTEWTEELRKTPKTEVR